MSSEQRYECDCGAVYAHPDLIGDCARRNHGATPPPAKVRGRTLTDAGNLSPAHVERFDDHGETGIRIVQVRGGMTDTLEMTDSEGRRLLAFLREVYEGA